MAMLIQIEGEGSQRPFLGGRTVIQPSAHHVVVIDERGDRAGHERAPGQGSATSRNAATLTAA